MRSDMRGESYAAVCKHFRNIDEHPTNDRCKCRGEFPETRIKESLDGHCHVLSGLPSE